MGKKWYRGEGQPIGHKICEATGKTIFESRNAADRAANSAMKYRARELRTYECNKCWGWHMTSRRNDKYL